MTSCHASVLFDTSTGMGCPNNGAQFNKCGLKGCPKYTSIKLPQYCNIKMVFNNCIRVTTPIYYNYVDKFQHCSRVWSRCGMRSISPIIFYYNYVDCFQRCSRVWNRSWTARRRCDRRRRASWRRRRHPWRASRPNPSSSSRPCRTS